MDHPDRPAVAVVIAAHDAEPTLARAIRSALLQPETSEVLVVDDASNDGTLRLAEAEAERDKRVRVIAFAQNAGPAAARNAAFDAAEADIAAILDSDDVFLPGRLGRLLSGPPAEITADNIAFVADDALETASAALSSPEGGPRFESLTTAEFVRGNLARTGMARGELGFLKPILSLPFLRTHGLRYDETLRLAEDYDLYVRMMLAGARFSVTRCPGYLAVIRPGSLSARHGTDDLARLLRVVERHMATDDLPGELSDAIRALRDEVRAKHEHRAFLDLRRTDGARAALRYAIGGRRRGARIARGILRDKLNLSGDAGAVANGAEVRLLLEATTGDAPQGR
ncbi:glycosyltransferase family 2 protein [uncultured Jannaschia sp.]|uniref:glycosyltransferase family 2 protein n=1 Tax=uncultured Jannaschia sp. TaxID=293347 RepID=UPI002619DED4|nr:glycosyltransferase family 2 protein [uncultured Jannaschia sp.]